MGGACADQLLALWFTQRSSLLVCRGFPARMCLVAGSHRLPEGSGRSLQPVADLPEFSGCGVDALLLRIRALLLSFGSEAQRFQLRVHLLDCPREIRQLCRNARYVFSGGQTSLILCGADASNGRALIP
jgi:hypothetical protein